VNEYHKRGHTWPPKPEDYIPNTKGWRKLMQRRLNQVEHISDLSQRYNGFMVTVYSSLIAPNFTENGWGLTRAPQELVNELRSNLHSGLGSSQLEPETEDLIIQGALPPLMLRQQDLNDKAMHALRPIIEEWSHAHLVPFNAYGLRIYRNESILHMHTDQRTTHIISCIFHIDHDPVSDPWPLVIEDFNGNTIEIVLEPGDLLFYESSKCLHGRPRPFNGAWYTSLFLHYYPVGWDGEKLHLDTHHRIPPNWDDIKKTSFENDVEDAVVLEVSFYEPSCKDQWCALQNAKRWDGPGEEGKVLTSAGKVTTLGVVGKPIGNEL